MELKTNTGDIGVNESEITVEGLFDRGKFFDKMKNRLIEKAQDELIYEVILELLIEMSPEELEAFTNGLNDLSEHLNEDVTVANFGEWCSEYSKKRVESKKKEITADDQFDYGKFFDKMENRLTEKIQNELTDDVILDAIYDTIMN